MPNQEHDLSFTLLPASVAKQDKPLREAWLRILERHQGDANQLYASPEWLEHISLEKNEGECFLCVVKRGEEILGAITIEIKPYFLTYDIYNRVLFKNSFKAAYVCGCELVLPALPAAYHGFFSHLLRALPQCDCIYDSSFPVNSYLYEFVQGIGRSSREFTPYLPFGTRPWHFLDLANSYDQYLESIGQKMRYNRRREVKKLREEGGSLELRCATTEEDVTWWLEGADNISEKTWQHRVLGLRFQNNAENLTQLRALARQQLLRAYLLVCGSEPIAFSLGYQYRGVYHYAATGYDPSLSAFSPGSVLLFLIIEDLFKHQPPKLLNFGIGDAAYKRRFGNREEADAAVVVFRRTIINRLKQTSHRLFQDAISLAKRLIRRSNVK